MNAQFTQNHNSSLNKQGTSRGVLTTKETLSLEISKNGQKELENAIFRGLSYDDVPDYEENSLGFAKIFIKILKF